jgi:hypothetical protein
MRTSLFAIIVASMTNAAAAETMSWKVATVVATQQGSETVRRGVAIFSNGEPATLTLRLRPIAPPSGGRMPFTTETIYRFDDGSTITVVGKGEAQMSPEGVPLPLATTIEGTFSAGSGRFSGISGTVTLTSRSGMDRTSPGVLGDQFSAAEATYKLPAQ